MTTHEYFSVPDDKAPNAWPTHFDFNWGTSDGLLNIGIHNVSRGVFDLIPGQEIFVKAGPFWSKQPIHGLCFFCHEVPVAPATDGENI